MTTTATTRPADHSTEVPVHAGVLRATAELLDLLQQFLADADTTVRSQLGRFLIARHNHEDTTDPTMQAAIMLHGLGEAADLLHTLAGDPDTRQEQAR